MYPASPLPFLAKEFLPSIWVVDFQVDRPKAYVLFDYDYSNVCVWVCVCECVCVWVWVSVSVSMCVCVCLKSKCLRGYYVVSCFHSATSTWKESLVAEAEFLFPDWLISIQTCFLFSSCSPISSPRKPLLSAVSHFLYTPVQCYHLLPAS